MRSGDISGVAGGTGVDLVLHCNRFALLNLFSSVISSTQNLLSYLSTWANPLVPNSAG